MRKSHPLTKRKTTVLIAPTYAPAASYEPPFMPGHVISLKDCSLAELMNDAAAWDIVLRHLPSMTLMTGSPNLKPQLGNFTVYSMQTFGLNAAPEVLAAIEKDLARLPPVEASSL